MSSRAFRRRTLVAVCTLGGLALFAYVVQRAGAAEIVEGVRRVGWGLTAILALQGLRFLLRTECWRLCMPPDTHLPFRRAFSAFLAGDAIGSVTPLGLLASEPTKVFLTRHHLAPRESVASLAVENVMYAASVAGMVALGLLVVLVTVPLTWAWRLSAFASLGLVAAGVLAVRRILQRPANSERVRPPWREQLSRLRLGVAGFSIAHGRRLWQVLALDAAFHALAVAEIFLTLQWLMGDRAPTLAQAVVFEALNRVVTVAFKFVPFRVGVDEALTGAAAPVLAVNPTAAVALAVVRKVRNLFWSLIGLLIIAVHPAEPSTGFRRGTSSLRPL